MVQAWYNSTWMQKAARQAPGMRRGETNLWPVSPFLLSMKATYIYQSTMLGVGGYLPIQGGNCFSVGTGEMKDGMDEAYYVVNMRLENFEGLIKQGRLSWPVEIWQLTNDHCMIIDERVPEDWYSKYVHFCTSCFPVQIQREKATLQRYSEGLQMADNDRRRKGRTARTEEPNCSEMHPPAIWSSGGEPGIQEPDPEQEIGLQEDGGIEEIPTMGESQSISTNGNEIS